MRRISSANAAPHLYDGQVKLKEGEVAWAKNAYIVHQDPDLVLMIMPMMGIIVMAIWMGLGIMVIIRIMRATKKNHLHLLLLELADNHW